jgi:hypothetical protein
MMALLESHFSGEPHAVEAAQEPGTQAPPGDVWLGESAPEEFLREVMDTLTGILRADLEAEESKTPYVLPDR